MGNLIKFTCAIVCLLIAVLSCQHDPFPAPPDTLNPGDTSCNSHNLTYNNSIKTIVDNNCINCHGGPNPQVGLSLETYNQVRDALLNTDLLLRVKNDPSVPVMPPGGKMPDCNIEKIEIWFTNSMPQ